MSVSYTVVTFLFFLLIGLGIAIPTSNFFTIDNLTGTISKVPIDKIFKSDNEEPKIYTYLSRIGLSKDTIYTFLDKTKFKDILGENLGSKILNKINGFEIKIPDENKVTDFIYENLEYVKKIFFFETTREDVYKVVHKNYDFVSNLINDVSDKIDLTGFDNLKYIAKFIRKGTVYLLEIGIAICVLLIIIFRASIYKWLMWIHIPTMMVSIIFFALGFLGNNLLEYIVSKLKIMFLLDPFVKFFTKSFINYALILFGISMLSLILHFLIKHLKNKRKKEEKENDQKLNEVLS